MYKKVTTLEALKECLSAYYFQEGSRVNKCVIRRMESLIKKLEKENKEESK